MDADSSPIVDVDGFKSLRVELAAVLTAFEQATGLQVCFRPLSDRWQDSDGVNLIAGPFMQHRSPFCQMVKVRSVAACVKCDVTDLPTVCSLPKGGAVEPIIRTCHAGADEILLPLWSESVLVAVLFVGQFTQNVGNSRGSAALRHVPHTSAEHLRMLTLPLRSYLMGALARLDGQRQEHEGDRRGLIEAYIRESLAAGPALPELARRLSLSRSRTSHVVRELTGRSFQDLVEERRIRVAKDLLTHSDGAIAWVARQTGFNDIAYFCRYFKRKTATTPTTFRTRHRRVLSV